jgi:hypothetical protein
VLRSDGTGGATLQNSAVTIDDSGVVTVPNNISTGSIRFDGTASRLRSSGASVFFEGEVNLSIGCTSIADVMTFATANNSTPFARIIGYANNARAELGLYTKSGQTASQLLLGDSTVTTLVGLGSSSSGVFEINNGTLGTLRDLSCRAITTTGDITTSLIRKGVAVNDAVLTLENAAIRFGYNANGTNRFYLSGGVLLVHSTHLIGWNSNSADATNGTYTMLGRSSEGVVEVNNGTLGTLRDFRARDLTASGLMCAGVYTFATVPSASSNTGKFLRISDRAQKHAYSDGTNWRFFGDDAVIS